MCKPDIVKMIQTPSSPAYNHTQTHTCDHLTLPCNTFFDYYALSDIQCIILAQCYTCKILSCCTETGQKSPFFIENTYYLKCASRSIYCALIFWLFICPWMTLNRHSGSPTVIIRLQSYRVDKQELVSASAQLRMLRRCLRKVTAGTTSVSAIFKWVFFQ